MFELTEIMKHSLLPAVFVAISLVLLKKSLSNVVSGVIKTMIGFFLLAVGMNTLKLVISPLYDLIYSEFGVYPLLLNSEMMGASLTIEFGLEGFAVMIAAMGVNLLLARYTKINAVYTTGHHFLYSALLAVVILKTVSNLPTWAVVLVGGIVVGIYSSLSVKATQPILKRLTGNNKIGFANSCTSAVMVSCLIAKLYKGKEKFTKDQKSRFEIKDVVVLSTIVMFMYYFAFNLLSNKIDIDTIVECIIYAIGFGAVNSVVFLGVRMLLADIINIMHIFQNKFAPNAIKGLDASAVVSYSPVAWIWGFIISFASGVLVLIISLIISSEVVVLPGVASCFFAGGASAVFANAYGGKRAVVISSIIIGVLIPVLISVLVTALPSLNSYSIAFGEMEYSLWGSLFALFTRIFSALK